MTHSSLKMYVIKRNGERELMRYDKITDRNVELATGLEVDVAKLSQSVIQSLKNGMTTEEIDQLSAETAFFMSTYEPDFDALSARIAVSNLHKTTSSSFVEVCEKLHEAKLFRDDLFQFVQEHSTRIQQALDFSKDYEYSYFGFKTLEKSYLLKIGKKVVERPQHMLMRVAICVHGPFVNKNGAIVPGDIDKAIQVYKMLSKGLFTHASPTIFNAGSNREQLSSCFLLHTKDDLHHIYETNLRSALISKHAGGIGIDISSIRAKGSAIKSTNGKSDGIVPMIKVFNATAAYCNQCFVGETLVAIRDEHSPITETPTFFSRIRIRFVPISTIKVGDFVMAMSGQFREVTQVHQREVVDEQVYTIYDGSNRQVTCTGQHNFFVATNDEKGKGVNYSFVQACDLTIDHSIMMPGHFSTSRNRIYSIDISLFTGKVYDLTVDVEHNYLTQIGIAHNSGKRKGSIAMYLQPFHPDIFDFLGLRLNIPPEEMRARDIFLAMWVPDLFMKRVEEKGLWSLICPSVEPRLCETYGEEFEKIYLECEREKKYNRQVPAEDVFKAILHSQIETGMPYMLYKDKINKASMQKNIGIIRSSNLCVHGDTQLLTRDGYVPIKDLAESVAKAKVEAKAEATVEVWNGFEWTSVRPIHTGIASRMLKIWFSGQNSLFHDSNDTYVMMTDYHKVPLADGESGTKLVEAKEVQPGDTLSWWMVPSIEPSQTDSSKLVVNHGNPKLKIDVRVAAIEEVFGAFDTYCFTDHKRGLGVFNGVLLGNCAEIVEYTDGESVSVCNLSSIALPKFVETNQKSTTMNWELLGAVSEQAIENLNRIIDINYYPVEQAKKNNLEYRPVGLGVQGLADLFCMFNVNWGGKNDQGEMVQDPVARWLNRVVSEVMYFHALNKSADLAQLEGPYSKFEGSPISQGKLQYHLWYDISNDIDHLPWTDASHPMRKQIPEGLDIPILDWSSLIEKCKKGVRNSLLLANMPTASTSQILNNNECIEPFTSNLYSRSVLSGDFIIINKHLYKDLRQLGLWDKPLVDQIIEGDGSVQHLDQIPDSIRKKYATVWELSQKLLIDYAADRAPFIDQTQSMNLFIDHPTNSKLSSMHMYTWKKGLKTGMYYLRSKPAKAAVKFSILKDTAKSSSQQAAATKPVKKNIVCTDEICTVCSA